VALEAFIYTYEPVFYERIGLKYVDVFQRSKLGLQNVEWSEMLHPFAVGYFAHPSLSSSAVKNFNSLTEIDIGNGAIAQINTFLAHVGEIKNGKPAEETELAIVAVSDLFFIKKELSEVDVSLEYLHSVAYRLIRAMITDKLHLAMEPQECL